MLSDLEMWDTTDLLNNVRIIWQIRQDNTWVRVVFPGVSNASTACAFPVSHACSLWHRTTKFDVLAHMRRGLFLSGQPRPTQRGEVLALPKFVAPLYLCVQTVSQKYKISHGIKYGDMACFRLSDFFVKYPSSECKFASSYQMWSKSDMSRLRYEDKAIFNMAAVRHLEFAKIAVLITWPMHLILHLRSKFRFNWHRDVAIRRFSIRHCPPYWNCYNLIIFIRKRYVPNIVVN